MGQEALVDLKDALQPCDKAPNKTILSLNIVDICSAMGLGPTRTRLLSNYSSTGVTEVNNTYPALDFTVSTEVTFFVAEFSWFPLFATRREPLYLCV